MSEKRANTHAYEGVRTGKPMEIGQRCLVLLTTMTFTRQGRVRTKAKSITLDKKQTVLKVRGESS